MWVGSRLRHARKWFGISTFGDHLGKGVSGLCACGRGRRGRACCEPPPVQESDTVDDDGDACERNSGQSRQKVEKTCQGVVRSWEWEGWRWEVGGQQKANRQLNALCLDSHKLGAFVVSRSNQFFGRILIRLTVWVWMSERAVFIFFPWQRGNVSQIFYVDSATGIIRMHGAIMTPYGWREGLTPLHDPYPRDFYSTKKSFTCFHGAGVRLNQRAQF